MSQKTSEFEPAIRRLERQAAESIHEDTDLLTVVCGFDLSEAKVYENSRIEWNARYGYEPMVRAFYCKELSGFTTEELHEYLTDAERARTLGFDPGRFAPDKTAPGRTTFGRAWRERFPERLKTFIQASAERILGVAHEVGNPLGMRALESEDKSDLSSRSEQRYIDSKAKKVTQALCEYVFPAMDLDRPDDGTRYDDTAFLELQSYLGLTDTAANQGSRLFDEETTRESGGPDSDTHLHYIKQIEAMEIASMVNGAIAEMVDVAKRYYSIDRHVDVAIDVTYIAYYGDRDEFQSPSKNFVLPVTQYRLKSLLYDSADQSVSVDKKEPSSVIGRSRPLLRGCPAPGRTATVSAGCASLRTTTTPLVPPSPRVTGIGRSRG
jgi:hypothetical protein